MSIGRAPSLFRALARDRRNGREIFALSLAGLLVLPPGSFSSSSAAQVQTLPVVFDSILEELSASPAPDISSRARAKEALSRLPLYFIANEGQADSRVAFYVHRSTTSLYFTRDGIVFSLAKASRPLSNPLDSRTFPSTVERWAVRLSFEGANPDVKITGQDPTEAKVSYFRGDRSQWKTALPTFGSVVYEELWPGIDLVYGSSSGRLKYTFLVKPGADPGRIRLRYEGANSVRLTEEGRLAVETPVGGFEEDAPYSYQEEGDDRTEVASEFVAEGASGDDAFRFGFRVGSYDRAKLLVLDPVVLTYAGFIGGSGTDDAWKVAIDSSGNAYVVGRTTSSELDFPVTVGPDLTYSFGTPPEDAFIAKVNSSGTALIYCGYIGGDFFDIAYDVAVDSSGAAYVVGTAVSTQSTFPVIVGPDTTHNGSAGAPDAFIAKVAPDGASLVYCGYIGGTGTDEAYTVAVDSSGNAYVGGYTSSTTFSFPETGGPDLTYGGGNDGWVAKVKADGTSPLIYCTYIGGTGNEEVNGIAIDSSGNAYIGGQTASSTGLPPVGGFDSSFNGGTNDAFVAKIAAGSPPTWAYFSYVGGSGNEEVNGVALDSSNNLFVAGTTSSDELSFPASGGPDGSFNGSFDAFVGKLQSSGLAFDYIGYIGGSGIDAGMDIAINSMGGAYVVGWTDSTEATFPETGGPDLTQNGGQDAFVALVRSNGTGLVYCGYIGGSAGEQGKGIAVDGSGFSYVTGFANSTEATFPVTVGPDLLSNGGTDAFIAKVDPGITAVELLSFEAKPAGGAGTIELSWKTGSELRNLGFHLYRASEAAGPYDRITPSLIPGLGSSPEGATYTYVDSGLENGSTYFYLLEDVETSGRTERHGPVFTTASDGGAASAPAASASITYGDPSAVSFRVLRRGRTSATLELTTGGFYAIPLPDGSVRFDIPTFEERSEPGSPAVPVKRAWIEVLAGRGVKLTSVKPSDIVTFTGLEPVPASSPVIVASTDGTVRAGRRSARARFGSEGLYPEEPARLLGSGFQGEIKKAQIELSPLRWDAASGQLLLARRLVVQVLFADRDVTERSSGGFRGRRHGESRAHGSENPVLVRLSTRASGLHAVRFDEILGARRRPLATSHLNLTYQGEPVAFHVAPQPEVFGPDSVLYFVSGGASLNPYGSEAVYELRAGEGGTSMPVETVSAQGPTVPDYLQRAVWELDRYYQAGLLDAPDLWLWDVLVSPASKSYPFTLSSVAPATESARLSIELQGGSDFESSPDHHMRASVNGVFLGEARWDGKRPRTLEAEVPAAVLRDGENVLKLENVSDTGTAYSMVFLNRFALTYPRLPVAEAGRLEGRWTSSGVTEIAGLTSNAFLLDTSESTPRWLRGAIGSTTGLQFRAEAGRSYLAVAEDAVLAPELKWPTPSRLRSTRNRADYLLISPSAFLDTAEPLVARRRSEGLLAKALAIEEIYQEFGYGESRPDSLKEFLSYAYHHWQAPSVRYVVLLGDATYDFKNVLGLEVENRVPPFPIKTTYLWTASDPAYAAVNGEDILPDIAIGRLPASSVEEARRLVDKILAWEEGLETLSGRSILVADNADDAGNFEANADEISSSLLPSREVERIYLRDLGSSTRDAIVRAFDRGPSLLSYVGHGGISLWASENVFNGSDVATLSPQPQQPLVLTLNCLNGYFHFPWLDSLSEALIKAEGKGAIAAFSPSGLSLNEAAHVYHQALVRELDSGRHVRLGDAILAAQASYADSGAFPELLSIYHLLGDPGLTLK